MNRYKNIAQKVYEKAETIYKGSEINADTLYSVLKTFNYSERTNKIVYNIFIEWERECY